MKRKILYLLATLVLLGIASTTSLAQEQLLFRVSIPFEFIAGGVHMGSGDYLAFHATPTILKFVREDGKASAWVTVKPSSVLAKEGTNQIVFTKYGNTYFLSKVQTGHDQQNHECYQCREEQTLAAHYRTTEVTTIALAATK